MKKTCFLLILLFSVLNVSAQKTGRTIRIACVGNSITYGAGIQDREKNCYPAQLQTYLGDNYLVANFGCSGTTANSKGDYPYIHTAQHKQSMDFLPDIVLIKLGTNDTKPQNWRYKDNLKKDYQALIDEYKQLSSHPPHYPAHSRALLSESGSRNQGRTHRVQLGSKESRQSSLHLRRCARHGLQKLAFGQGRITVIHKPGVDHHPHSLSDPAPIVRFVLKATGHDANFYKNVPAEE